jgi:hypothetical protein
LIVVLVSLPIQVTCDARLGNGRIPIGGGVNPGVTFRCRVSLQPAHELDDRTAATFAVRDASGCILYHKSEPFHKSAEFAWKLPAVAIPAGPLTVDLEIGDPENEVHTRRTFAYKISHEMAATRVTPPRDLNEGAQTFPIKNENLFEAFMDSAGRTFYRQSQARIDTRGNLKVGGVLTVTMVPSLVSDGELVPFRNDKFFDELVDAAGEAFWPQAPADQHNYRMRLKADGAVFFTVAGESTVGNESELIVEFELSIYENLDFATGFCVDFEFEPMFGPPIQLSIPEGDVCISVSSRSQTRFPIRKLTTGASS